MVPEQLSHSFLNEAQKMNMISAETRLVGVLGDPINHSMSPTIQNAALREMNLNWNYMAIPCNSKNLEVVLSALYAIDCKGLNITIPHKTQSIKHCKHISPLAEAIGAVNTLIPSKEGGWIGDNTDIEGFIQPLNYEKNWPDKVALVIGSGGSAKAIVAGLKSLFVKKIIVINRSQDSLDKLLLSLNGKKSETQIEGVLSHTNAMGDIIKSANLIINTTPVGMYSKDPQDNDKNEIPLGREIWENLMPGTTLYDLIYNPKPTQWLKIGLQKDCKVIDGLEMLIQQGAASLRLWTGISDIPINSMKKAAESFLR